MFSWQFPIYKTCHAPHRPRHQSKFTLVSAWSHMNFFIACPNRCDHRKKIRKEKGQMGIHGRIQKITCCINTVFNRLSSSRSIQTPTNSLQNEECHLYRWCIITVPLYNETCLYWIRVYRIMPYIDLFKKPCQSTMYFAPYGKLPSAYYRIYWTLPHPATTATTATSAMVAFGCIQATNFAVTEYQRVKSVLDGITKKQC